MCLVVVLQFNVHHVLYFHFADIVECDEDPKACQDHATCNNTEGGFDCFCNGGFQASGSLCLGTFVPVTEASCNSPSVRETKHID